MSEFLEGHAHGAPKSTVAIDHGGLWRIRVRLGWPRYLLYILAGLAILRTVLAILAPAAVPRPVIVRPSGSDPAASGFAVMFARAYLSYDSQNPSAREQALKPFIGGGGALDQDAGFAPPDSGSQQVSAAELVQSVPLGGGRQRFTVMALTSQAGTVCLAVTVGRDSTGALQLVGVPAFVGAPRTAPAAADPAANGDDVADPALKAVIARAIGNYLSGSSTELQADLAPNTAVSTSPHHLRLAQLERMTWAAPGQVGVDLQATDRTGATWELHYTLAVSRRDRWYLTAIETNPTQPGGGS